jgi:hypothetical protein
VQPASAAQVASVVLLEHEEACWETHVPLPVAAQPGSEEQLDTTLQVDGAVPTQCGPVLKTADCVGKRVSADLQQIWFLQSLDWSQVLTQLVWQLPLQQISPAAVLQSEDWLHWLGQVE